MHHITKAILLAAVVLVLQGCSTTVQPGQRGLRWYPLTEGLAPETLKSGSYWRAPWNQINLYNVRWRRYTETVDVLSSDNLPVTLKTVVVMRPIPEELYFLVKEVGPDFYTSVAKREVLTAVRSVVSRYPMATILEHSSEISGEIEAVVVEKLKDRHVQVGSIAMGDIELAKVVLDSVPRKPAKEQETEQREFELTPLSHEELRARQ
jgi:regulator of protease activity HflC (stomatin/prohibitin superfamily)